MLPASTTPPHTAFRTLAVSVVTYRSDAQWLDRTLIALRAALLHALENGVLVEANVTLAANDGEDASREIFERRLAGVHSGIRTQLLIGQGNIGYGAANNLALRSTRADAVLVLNPDVEMSQDCVTDGLQYLAATPTCAMVSPVAHNELGVAQSLIKAMPNVLVLGLRGFAPTWLRDGFASRLQDYERAEIAFDAPLYDGVIVSGCFMLMRASAWHDSGGFDEEFFLYFEDFDLSKRISESSQIHRVPACRIVHAGGQASRKGGKHIGMFARSAARFFSKHGWRFW